MDYVDYVFENLNIAKDRLVTNSIASFEGMTAQRWIRIIVIIGGYMLVRPYLLGFAAKRQKAQFEAEAEELGLERDAGPNANSLRGGKKPSGGGKVLGEIQDDDSGKGKTRQRKNPAGSD
ncbi:trafficking PGA2-domain-containing protein [Ampelomyces quisqualis]|uniref:Trafficking PGA2-domain-containing protein n=1 Tax=Ampelomyces quisqualis TaxID=50730 RepID=A0A6A5QMU6_AMPQU|nr:trafficking PGA2-domain-containing protein [Ampelomyces quisqualis]